jgi:transcription elongation GreA/GreB family factor
MKDEQSKSKKRLDNLKRMKEYKETEEYSKIKEMDVSTGKSVQVSQLMSRFEKDIEKRNK